MKKQFLLIVDLNIEKNIIPQMSYDCGPGTFGLRKNNMIVSTALIFFNKIITTTTNTEHKWCSVLRIKCICVILLSIFLSHLWLLNRIYSSMISDESGHLNDSGTWVIIASDFPVSPMFALFPVIRGPLGRPCIW